MIETILSSSGLGAIVGVVGSWLTKREERANTELQLDHDIRMAEIRSEEARMEYDHALALADKKLEQTVVEGDVAVGQAELSAFTESLKSGSVSTGVRVVDAIRGVMRPVITIYLLIIGSYVAYQINAYVGGLSSLPTNELLSLYRDIISQILFLLTTAVTWWFGSRPSSSKK